MQPKHESRCIHTLSMVCVSEGITTPILSTPNASEGGHWLEMAPVHNLDHSLDVCHWTVAITAKDSSNLFFIRHWPPRLYPRNQERVFDLDTRAELVGSHARESTVHTERF